MIYYIYNILLILLYPILRIYFVSAARRDGRYTDTMAERFGRYSADLDKPAGKRRIWVHAVSVGEVVGAMPLLHTISERLQDCDMVVSTTTKTGRDMLLKTFPSVKTFYFPFDFPWVVARALGHIKPDLVVLMETELWPNVMTMSQRRGAPVLLLNGRVSDRMAAAGGLAKALYSFAFRQLDAVGMQTRTDADRIARLGAPSDKVLVIGNMKFDGLLSELDIKKTGALGELLNPARRPVFVAGSTHPGEEEIILDVFQEVREKFPDLLLVLAPRHIERAEEAEGYTHLRRIEVVRRTQLKPGQPHAADVVVLDTIGELRYLYALATACFVGGSLVERGGHNVLEPAACGKAPFYGPYMANFRDSAAALESGGGGRPVRTPEDLSAGIIKCLKDPDECLRVDANALAVLRQNAGAGARAFELLKKYLPDRN